MKKSIRNKKRLNKIRLSKKQSSGAPSKQVKCLGKNENDCRGSNGCAWNNDEHDGENRCKMVNCNMFNNDVYSCGQKKYCTYLLQKGSTPGKCEDTCKLLNSQYQNCYDDCRRRFNKTHCESSCKNILDKCEKIYGCINTNNKCLRNPS